MPTLSRLLLTVCLFLACSGAFCAEIAEVHFDEKTTLAGTELHLNGAGLRSKLMFKVYAIGLYLPQVADTSVAALSAKGAKRIQIVTLRELSAEQLADALVDGIRKNHGKAEQEKLAARVEILRNIMLSIGKAPEKTHVRLDYLPASGTRVMIGNEQQGADIPGEDFYLALLRIWLGEKPVQESIRDGLLGKK